MLLEFEGIEGVEPLYKQRISDARAWNTKCGLIVKVELEISDAGGDWKFDIGIAPKFFLFLFILNLIDLFSELPWSCLHGNFF